MNWILILIFYSKTALSIPGYASKDVCEMAGKQARQMGIPLMYMCVPGPGTNEGNWNMNPKK